MAFNSPQASDIISSERVVGERTLTLTLTLTLTPFFPTLTLILRYDQVGLRGG